MNIIINQKNITLSDSQLEFVNKKIEKLSKLSNAVKDESSEIKINISKHDTKQEEDQIEVSINLSLPMQDINAISRGITPEAALIDAREKIIVQLDKYKEKHHRS